MIKEDRSFTQTVFKRSESDRRKEGYQLNIYDIAAADYAQPVQCLGLAIPADCPDNVRAAYQEAFAACMNSETIKKAVEDGNMNTFNISGDAAQSLAIEQEKVCSWALFDAEVAPKDPSTLGIERP